MTEEFFNNIIRVPITRQAKNAIISKLTGFPPEAIDALLKKVYKPGTKIFGFTFGSNKKTLANFFLENHLKHKIDLAKKQQASGYVSPDTLKEINIAKQAQADAKLLIDQQKRNAVNRKLERSLKPTSKNPTQITRKPSANTIKPTVDYSIPRPYPLGHKLLPPRANTINPTAPRGFIGTGSSYANLANFLGISQKKLTSEVLKGPHQLRNIKGYVDKKLIPEESRQYQNPTDSARAKATGNTIVKTGKLLKPSAALKVLGGVKNIGAGLLINYALDKTLMPIAEGAGRWVWGDVLTPAARALDDAMPGMNSADERRRHRLNTYYQNLDEESN